MYKSFLFEDGRCAVMIPCLLAAANTDWTARLWTLMLNYWTLLTSAMYELQTVNVNVNVAHTE